MASYGGRGGKRAGKGLGAGVGRRDVSPPQEWRGAGGERKERGTLTLTEVNTEGATLPSTRTSLAEEGGQEIHLTLRPPLRVPPKGRAGFAGRSDPSLGTRTKREKGAMPDLPHLAGSEWRGHCVRGDGEGNGLVP